MDFLDNIYNSDFAYFLQDNTEAYYGLLAVHSIGMALVVGVSFMLSAKVLGYGTTFPFKTFQWLSRVAWFGFAMNLVSGVLLWVKDPVRLTFLPAFQIKLLMIVLAGISLWVLFRTVRHGQQQVVAGAAGGGYEVFSMNAKIVALVPVALWLGAIVAGRLIGYTMDMAIMSEF